jgi:hypothetical protein
MNSQGNVGTLQQYTVGGVDNYVCIAYQSGGAIRIVVFDSGGEVNASLRESPTVIIDRTVDLTDSYLAGWGQAEGNVWLVYGSNPLDGASGLGVTRAIVFRSSTATLDTNEIVIQPDEPPHFVSSDGTNIFVVCRYGVEGYRVMKFDAEMTLVDQMFNNETGLGLSYNAIAIDARQGFLDMVRHSHTTGRVYVSRLKKNILNAPTFQNVYVTTGDAPAVAGTGHSNVTIATTGPNTAVIAWANQLTSTVQVRPAYLSCGVINMDTGALLSGFNHSSLVPYAQPFIYDGRVFFVAMHTTGLVHPNASETDLTGTSSADESFMCVQVPLDTMSGSSLPFPCAQWDYGRIVAKQSFFNTSSFGSLWLNGRHVYQSGSGVYVLTNVASGVGESELSWAPVPRLVRLEMADATHRWRAEEFHDYAAFAGGVPFSYDGTRAYELATALHRPVHLAFGVSNGGSLAQDTKHFFRVAMLHVDGNGRECWSQPSATVEVTTNSTDKAAYMVVSPVVTTVRPDMGNGAGGRMFLYMFGTTSDAPNEFKVCAEPAAVWPGSIEPVYMECVELSEANTAMYTNGFELDNFPAPPCRVIAAHSGRLFVIASDSNELWYTKPYRAERGPEFALGQSVPLPDKGTALMSLNDRLAIFTHRGILAVGGDGPDVTGTPPDAFSRPVLVSPDYGCVEYNAVGRTPLGVIFRGHQGFYLLTMGFEVAYIGAQVEDTTSRWQATRSIVHDQKSACCRVTGFTGDRSEELCYWYDTKRWSMNLLARDVVDSVALGDNLLIAVADTTVALASRHRLGSREGAVSYQDFDESYGQTLETGWLSFQQAGTFKRIWRVYVLARAAGADSTIRVQVWKDWEDTPSSDREFELIAADTEPRNLRIHLKHQKLKAIKVRVTVTSAGAGADVMKVGFELGVRTGGPKEPRENTQ